MANEASVVEARMTSSRTSSAASTRRSCGRCTPGKPTPVAAQFVDQTRREWGVWARSAQYVTVIGAAPNLADHHVWQPILDSSSTVWYVGGEERDFADFSKALGTRLSNLGHRMSDALPGIERRLSVTERYETQDKAHHASEPSSATSLSSEMSQWTWFRMGLSSAMT